MSGEGEMVPDWQLERFRLQELSPAEQEFVAGAAERSETVRARLAELERSDRAILALHPPRLAAEAITARTGRPMAPRPTRGLRPALAVAASVVVLLALAQLRPAWRGPTTVARPPDETRIKGTRPELVIYRQADRGAEPLGDGALVRAHDVVQVLYVAAGGRYGVIVSVDGRGGVTVHLPAGEPRAAELAENRLTPLVSAYELDDAPAFERFFFVTSSAPFDVALVTDAARRLASRPLAEGPTRLDLPLAFGQSTFLLRKDGPR
jgi:hypothetical protein